MLMRIQRNCPPSDTQAPLPSASASGIIVVVDPSTIVIGLAGNEYVIEVYAYGDPSPAPDHSRNPTIQPWKPILSSRMTAPLSPCPWRRDACVWAGRTQTPCL